MNTLHKYWRRQISVINTRGVGQAKKRLVYGALWAFSGQALGTVAGLVSAALLARLITAAELGSYFLALSLVTVGSVVLQMGLGRSAIRLIAHSLAMNDVRGAWVATRSVFLLATMMTLLGGILLYGYGIEYLSLELVRDPALDSFKGLILLWMISFTYRNLAAEVFRGYHDIRTAVMLGDPLTRALFALLLVFAWVTFGKIALESVLYIMLFCVGASAAVGCVKLREKKQDVARAGFSDLKVLFYASFPFMVTGLSNLAYSQADLWVIGSYGAPEDVALYGVAIRLVLLVSGSLLVLNAVLPSIIVDLHAKGDLGRLQYILRTSATIAGIPSVILLITFVVFGDKVLDFLYGPYYADAHLILAVLSIGHLMSVSTGSAGLSLMMSEHHKVMMVVMIISAIALIVGGVLAISRFGVLGVAIVNASVTTLNCIASLFLARRYLGIWTHAGITHFRVSDIMAIYNLVFKKNRQG